LRVGFAADELLCRFCLLKDRLPLELVVRFTLQRAIAASLLTYGRTHELTRCIAVQTDVRDVLSVVTCKFEMFAGYDISSRTGRKGEFPMVYNQLVAKANQTLALTLSPNLNLNEF